jgi:hypothetical protein
LKTNYLATLFGTKAFFLHLSNSISFQTVFCAPGTDVMSLKIFLPKKSAKKWRV